MKDSNKENIPKELSELRMEENISSMLKIAMNHESSIESDNSRSQNNQSNMELVSLKSSFNSDENFKDPNQQNENIEVNNIQDKEKSFKNFKKNDLRQPIVKISGIKKDVIEDENDTKIENLSLAEDIKIIPVPKKSFFFRKNKKTDESNSQNGKNNEKNEKNMSFSSNFSSHFSQDSCNTSYDQIIFYDSDREKSKNLNERSYNKDSDREKSKNFTDGSYNKSSLFYENFQKDRSNIQKMYPHSDLMKTNFTNEKSKSNHNSSLFLPNNMSKDANSSISILKK